MDLYATLSLDSSSNDQDIKRAYKNLALKNHPDRFPHASEDQRKQLTDTFQKLSQAYAILSDTNKKARYDATGSIDDIADLQEGFATWTEYFETIFTRLTEEAIEKYEKQYKCWFELIQSPN